MGKNPNHIPLHNAYRTPNHYWGGVLSKACAYACTLALFLSACGRSDYRQDLSSDTVLVPGVDLAPFAERLKEGNLDNIRVSFIDDADLSPETEQGIAEELATIVGHITEGNVSVTTRFRDTDRRDKKVIKAIVGEDDKLSPNDGEMVAGSLPSALEGADYEFVLLTNRHIDPTMCGYSDSQIGADIYNVDNYNGSDQARIIGKISAHELMHGLRLAEAGHVTEWYPGNKDNPPGFEYDIYGDYTNIMGGQNLNGLDINDLQREIIRQNITGKAGETPWLSGEMRYCEYNPETRYILNNGERDVYLVPLGGNIIATGGNPKQSELVDMIYIDIDGDSATAFCAVGGSNTILLGTAGKNNSFTIKSDNQDGLATTLYCEGGEFYAQWTPSD